ncbi:protein SKR-5, partial [Diaporthe sp. PMI_573]
MSSNNLTIRTRDDILITLDPSVLKDSKTLPNLVRDFGVDKVRDTPILLPTIDAKTLKMVVEWCEYHAANFPTPDNYYDKNCEIQEWELKFMRVDKDILIGVIHAADHLDIRNLLDCSCKKAADMV